jgi:hypothetical protein
VSSRTPIDDNRSVDDSKKVCDFGIPPKAMLPPGIPGGGQNERMLTAARKDQMVLSKLRVKASQARSAEKIAVRVPALKLEQLPQKPGRALTDRALRPGMNGASSTLALLPLSERAHAMRNELWSSQNTREKETIRRRDQICSGCSSDLKVILAR